MHQSPEPSVLDDFRRNVFYHGTYLEAAERIANRGFCVSFYDEDIGRYRGGGNHGEGVYVTSDWRVALWYGDVLLRVGIQPGTRLLNAAIPPDRAILDYLQKEFGRRVLTDPLWKVLPKNKHLKLREVICLMRYHYERAWQMPYARARKWHDRGGAPYYWTGAEKRSWASIRWLRSARTMLARYGFHGYGSPVSDNGIVVFAEDRLVLEEVVGEVRAPTDAEDTRDWKQSSFRDLEEVKEYAKHHSRRRARMLVEKVAAARQRQT